MELKDMILSTLAEMETTTPEAEPSPEIKVIKNEPTKKESSVEIVEEPEKKQVQPIEKQPSLEDKPKIKAILEEQLPQENHFESEEKYLKALRERLLVLFEGFQAPNNSSLEAKIDLTLNFLEYVLANIDQRITLLEQGK